MKYLTKKNIKWLAVILYVIGYFYVISMGYGDENGRPYTNGIWDHPFADFYSLTLLIVLPTYFSFILMRRLIKIRKYLLLLAIILNFGISVLATFFHGLIIPMGDIDVYLAMLSICFNLFVNFILFIYFPLTYRSQSTIKNN
jgi:hypothetical protein